MVLFLSIHVICLLLEVYIPSRISHFCIFFFFQSPCVIVTTFMAVLLREWFFSFGVEALSILTFFSPSPGQL